MKFRITFLLWLFALLAAAMGTFGPIGGGVLAAFVLVVRFGILVANPTKDALFAGIIWIVLGLLLVALLMPAVGVSRAPSLRGRSMSQMKQLVLAMHSYRSDHGRFPPSFSVDEAGRPLHSWRTLLLPYLGELTLYNAIRLDEPWNSPANKKLLHGIELEFMQSPRRGIASTGPTETHYLAITGPETIWATDDANQPLRQPKDCPQALMIVECAGRGIPWYEPRDLTQEQGVALLSGETSEEAEVVYPGPFLSHHVVLDGPIPRLIGLAEGRTISLYNDLTPETALDLLDGVSKDGSTWDEYKPGPQRQVVRKYDTTHWGRVWSLALFVVLSLLPLRWFVHKSEPATRNVLA